MHGDPEFQRLVEVPLDIRKVDAKAVEGGWLGQRLAFDHFEDLAFS
jgi:hypothetical protein